MSDNTIQARNYTARQAALLQQRPRELIQAAQNVAGLGSTYSRPVHVLLPHSGGHHSSNVSIAGLTADTRFMMMRVSWPTTAPGLLVVDADEYPAEVETSWSRWAGQAKDALQSAASAARRQTTAAARWRVERLSALQAAFGFTILDLAAVLAITRPQLYKWLDAANDIKLQEASRARLATVERIAKEWNLRSPAPLSSVSKEPLAGGGTVFESMSADVIDEAAVVGALDELAGKLLGKPKSRSQRLREAGLTRRPSVRSLPSDE